jgi:hypothetical protein
LENLEEVPAEVKQARGWSRKKCLQHKSSFSESTLTASGIRLQAELEIVLLPLSIFYYCTYLHTYTYGEG